MRQEILKGNIRHRRCDVCGCELAMPDIGLWSRKALNSAACTDCNNTKANSNFLRCVEDLRKTRTKTKILILLDKRMIETWGPDVSMFTIEEWDRLIENDRDASQEGGIGYV